MKIKELNHFRWLLILNYILTKDEIMKRRKMKFLSCSQGLEYLKFNKKVHKFKKEVYDKIQYEKSFNNNVKIFNVLENKKYLDEEKKDLILRKSDMKEKKRLIS